MEMKIQQKVSEAFVVFFKDPWTFILAALLAGVLCVITLGILAPVVTIGLSEMAAKTKRGEKAKFEDLFLHLDKTLNLCILTLLVGIGVFFGLLFVLIPGIILMALWMYAPYYMVFQNKGIMDSMKASAFTVNKHGLLGHIVIILVISLVGAIGGQLVIGWLFTYPLTSAFMMFLFEELKEA